jgi:hypothetical protein
MYKRDFAKAATVVLLVVVITIGTYVLFPEIPPQPICRTGVIIQDDSSATEDFINRTLGGGGGYTSIEYSPIMYLTFENGSQFSYSRSTNLMTETWVMEAAVNASGLQGFRVNWHAGRTRWSFSTEFISLVAGGNFSWYGIYSKGNEIGTALHLDSNRADLSTRFENNVAFVFDLNPTTIAFPPLIIRTVEKEYWPKKPVSPVLQAVSWDTVPCQGTEGWTMRTARILQMVGQSKSASITFDGSAWLEGNYTITENSVANSATVESKKNVSCGTIDMTFENGRISTLSFKFNAIDIILFALPEE